MKKEITCIACPRGCRLVLEAENRDEPVRGFLCPKGKEYGEQELKEPLRMLTTTVRTVSVEQPRLPVKLSCPVPLHRIRDFINAVNRLTLERSCRPGDVLAVDLLGSGADLLATGELILEGEDQP